MRIGKRVIFPIYRGYDTNNLILNRIFTPEISYNFVVKFLLRSIAKNGV